MLVLADLADHETSVIPAARTPSLTLLAEETGLGRSTAARSLNRLEVSGWVLRVRPDVVEAWANKARTQYRLAIPKLGTSPAAGLVQAVPEVPDQDTITSPRAGLVPERDQSTSPAAGQDDVLPGLGLVPERDSKEPTKINPKIKTKTSSEDSPDFVEFWATYPYRTAKGAARKAWAKAITRADPSVIISGAAKFRDDPRRNPAYPPHPATWLNADRWEDEPVPGSTHPNGFQPYQNPTDPSHFDDWNTP